ncbi:MAG TPA: hypothetical protein VJP58_07735 [Candidatus Nitrosocosmicus sp.]|nr:hypothetical protein [Candidatus Nitrosocosmicus sp.]
MTAIYLHLIASIIGMISLITGVSTYTSIANAQTPTTSDLPATIGNESTSDMGLTNNSMPAQNTSTINALPPV